ncbi:hypothetical protein AURDEDRAFT_173075 [Auricularia subglabra TFB-10046 SS5]|uniref:F-box domain-containing protein n=1 Tax=Auricularia subglabra (strain TFB-10046 / SS5) TaxID=717982 RepID=J0WV75_AURST|nr:hypothetical protein AURDEDRAFT_173075 [Auricularia subglabra TFB-10046 SS5]
MDGSPQSASADPRPDTTPPCSPNILPPELLCEIFAHLDRFADCVASTMVCRTWRMASLAAPAQLWNYVVSEGRKPDVLAQVLARAANVPICVTVTVLNTNASHLASAFQLHMHHIAHLSIHIGEDLQPDAARWLVVALSSPAPILETLIVMDIFGAIPAALYGAPPETSIMSAPELSSFKLFGEAFYYALPTLWPSLTQFLYAPPSEVLTTAVIDEHIALMDSLEILGIELGAWTDPQWTSNAIRMPASLQTLHLVCRSETLDLHELLQRIFPCSVRLLTIDYVLGCDVTVATELVAFMCDRFSPRDIAIFSSTSSNDIVLEVESDNGLVWEIYCISLIFERAMFSNVRTLSISDPEWARLHGRVPAPLLVSLSVRIITPYFMVEDGHKSLFLDMTASGLLVCPQLHTLVFETVPRGSLYSLGHMPTLAPEMLTEFMHNKVVFERERLAVLRLNGIDLLQAVVESVITLLGHVDDIQFGPGSNLNERDMKRMPLGWDL